MKPNSAPRAVESSGVSAVGQFGISEQDSAHIMTILRDTLYSDKILAVLREYSSNAWDSHKENGKEATPIKIHMPTPLEPTLTIRDFGPGLSQHDVLQVFTKYGRSTKRGSDAMVGMLGIGSKSGFAYSDSFTIISHHGGTKSTYVAVLDESEKGLINLLHVEPSEETGICIEIPVKPTDMGQFVEKAVKLFKYYDPRPDIDIELPPPPTPRAKLTNGVIYERNEDDYGTYHRTWVAVMGCVPYRINLDQLRGVNGSGTGVPEYLRGLSGALYFKIGEVQINASREELKYSDDTKALLIAKFDALVEEFVIHTLTAIEAEGLTFWEKRIKASVLKQLGLPVPASAKELMESSVSIKDFTPASMVITKMNREACTSVTIDKHVRFILKDSMQPLLGYQLTSYDYLVRPTAGHKADAVIKDLEALIALKGLTGVPIVKLSALKWEKPRYGSNGRTINKKHHEKSFVFKVNGGSDASSHWESIEREPTKDDVFVIIERFKTDFNFSTQHREDRQLCKAFNGPEMPPVYGYKTTGKEPKLATDCVGTEYREWRKTLLTTLFTPEIKQFVEQYKWAQLFNDYYYHRGEKEKAKKALLTKHLGALHPITLLFNKHVAARAVITGSEKHGHIGEISTRVTEAKLIVSFEAETELELILERYPLLKVLNKDLEPLWNAVNGPLWAQYINLIDSIDAVPTNADGGNTNGLTNPVHDEQREHHGSVQGEVERSTQGSTPVCSLEGSNPGRELGCNPQPVHGCQEHQLVGAGEVQAEGGVVVLRGGEGPQQLQ